MPEDLPARRYYFQSEFRRERFSFRSEWTLGGSPLWATNCEAWVVFGWIPQTHLALDPKTGKAGKR